MGKLWGGRFKKSLDDSAVELSYSIESDKRLYKQDIAVNRAHTKALAKAGILSAAEGKELVACLDDLEARFETDILPYPQPDEDIHSCIERLVVEKVGDLGKKMHTGKSRNDQVITDTRLVLLDEIARAISLLDDLQFALWELASANKTVIMPGFTHLQVAQPVLFAHHMLAYVEKFGRDRARLHDCLERMDECPLGSAALAGTNYPLDREFLAKELGFSRVTQNSMDGVSNRDFILEYYAAVSIMMLHLSQMSEEFIIWSSPILGWVTIGDDFTTGSSIMPQKKNPDVAELVRGKTGGVLAAFVGLHETVKGLALTYNRDLQEDKSHLFNVVDTVRLSLDCYAKMLPGITLHEAPIRKALETGFVLATEVADYLVLKGVPFRDAHEITGQLVMLAEENNCGLEQLSVKDMQQVSDKIGEDIADVLTLQAAIDRKSVVGGTATKQVKSQLKQLKEHYKWNKR